MVEDEEIHYEHVLTNFSAQDVAIEQASEKRLKQESNYEELLESCHEVKKEQRQLEEQNCFLRTKLVGAFGITNSYKKIHQATRNSSLNKDHNKILESHHTMANDSKKFHSSLHSCIKEFKNLRNNFDENSITKYEVMCLDENAEIALNIEESRTKLKFLNKAVLECEHVKIANVLHKI